ncbi:MAG: TonB-dependent receptor [Flavobacteriales bacterium]
MPFRKLLAPLLFLIAFAAQAQRFTVSGYVTDSATGEALIGASVFIQELNKGVPTNNYGFYSVTLEQADYTFVVRYIGYADLKRKVDLTSDHKINLALSTTVLVMKTVEVNGEKAKSQLQSTQMGRVDVDVNKLQALPALFGEVDILKTIQLLPGVQSNGEGNTGFYVRGGGPDQNLILLDEATVYNASHLFGFFSVFNADAVKDIELIKGGMPAYYGGRTSSVLDITMKDGNDKEFHGQGGIGLISSRFTFEGPIVKNKSSFIVSGRRTYIDAITKPFINKNSTFAGSGYYFYDLNAKANYRLSDKDRFFLSGYFGRDVFNLNGGLAGSPNFKIPWGNATVSGRWNHVYGPKLFMNATAVVSDYKFSFSGGQDEFGFKLMSGIRDYGLKLDFNQYPNIRNNVRYGIQYTYHIYTPSTVAVNSGDTNFNIDTPSKLNAHEAAAYIQDAFDVTDLFRINFGLRYSWFAQVGPYHEYLTDDAGNTIGTYDYSGGSIVKQYGGFEPRLSMRYTLDKNTSVKASVTRNLQYVHLASYSSIGLPTDTWIPSGKNVKPQEAWQYSAGLFRDLKQHTYEGSIELYYKSMANQIEYAEGASPQDGGNANYDAMLVFGKGWSYGAEFFLKRRMGRLTGWVGYTWSKTMRQFPEVDNDEPFPSRWDRRNDVSVVAGYELNERWTLGGTFVYSTGQATTLPVQRYFIENRLVSEYTQRNGFRMAPYHRLDVAATLKNKPTKQVTDKMTGEVSTIQRKYRSSWTFSIYNVYDRANPYFYYFDATSDSGTTGITVQAKQVSLFRILPSIAWNFEF